MYIASPNSLHYEQSKLFLQNGKHVICEKPITVEPEQLEELQQLAQQKQLIYLEALIGVYPVSYTHLDVYKRQPEKRIA